MPTLTERMVAYPQVQYIWTSQEPWLLWSRDAPDTLQHLILHHIYWFKADASVTIAGLPLVRGWNLSLWKGWGEEVIFTPGQFVSQADWEGAKKLLQSTGTYSFFKLFDIRVVKVAAAPPFQIQADWWMTVVPAERAIYVHDIPLPSVSLWAESISHEMVHMWQNDVRWNNSSGPKGELMAYMMTQMFRWLRGDVSNMFGPDSPYGVAKLLAEKEWNW